MAGASKASLIKVTTFEQFAKGDLVFETERGDVQRGVGYASMEGSFRIDGGMSAVIDALRAQIPTERIILNAPVVSVTQNRGVTLDDNTKITANHVVLTCPPRVAATLTFSPELDTHSLAEIPTSSGGCLARLPTRRA